MNKQVLVIAAHPDDEVIGCGGTLARHAALGDMIHLIFLADGESSRSGPQQASIGKRQAMARNAASILGCREPIFLGLADNQLDALPFLHIVQTLEQASRGLAPSVIYTHHGGDLNIDHRLTCQATLTAFRPQPGCGVQSIYAFDISSSTEWSHPSLTPSFQPQRFHDISPWLAIKEEALACYQSEMREKPHSRSIEGIRYRDLHRGHSVGCHAAEAFEVIREIW